jgi:hypothetical protein
MQVSVEDLEVSMDLGNNGITLSVRDTNGDYLGKLRIGRAKIEWRQGKANPRGQTTWPQLINFLQGDDK